MDNLFSPFWFSSLMVKMRGGKGLTHQQNNHSVRFRKARYECMQCRIRRDLFFTGSFTTFCCSLCRTGSPPGNADNYLGFSTRPVVSPLNRAPSTSCTCNKHTQGAKKMYPRCYLKMCINFFWTPPGMLSQLTNELTHFFELLCLSLLANNSSHPIFQFPVFAKKATREYVMGQYSITSPFLLFSYH